MRMSFDPIKGSRTDLLESLQAFTEDAVKDMLLPTRVQSKSESEGLRAPEVFKMRLPDSNSATKKAPYIIHQLITANDSQAAGQRDTSSAQVRSIFCVYSDRDDEGALMLVELIERVRIPLLRRGVVNNLYLLDREAGMEALYYPDNTAPYFMGEMVSQWILPSIEREVREWL